MKIQNQTPEEYAAQWGSSTKDGAYFYNFGSEHQVRSTLWLKEFQAVIERQIQAVQWADPSAGFSGLNQLLHHVKALIVRAGYQGGVAKKRNQ